MDYPTASAGRLEGTPTPQGASAHVESYSINAENLIHTIERGPVETRKITDIGYAICFGLFWITLIVLTVFALYNGSAPTPTQFFLQAPPFTIVPKAMINSMPEGTSFLQEYGVYHRVGSRKHSLIAPLSTSNDDKLNLRYEGAAEEQGATETAAPAATETTAPAATETAAPAESEGTAEATSPDSDVIMSDFYQTSWLLILVSFTSVGLALTFLVTVPACAEKVLWGTIYTFLVLITALGAYFLVQFVMPENASVAPTYLFSGIGLLLFALIILLVIVCCGDWIHYSIVIVAAATKFTKDVLTVVLIPIGVFVFFLLTFLTWIYAVSAVIDRKPVNPEDDNTSVIVFFYVVVLIWTAEVCIAFAQLTISTACSLWYFYHHPDNHAKTYTHVRTALWWGLIYHFGSVCFGGLILTTVTLLRMLMRQLYQDAEQEGNILGACCACCCEAILGCIENLIRYINKAAYIMIGLTSEPFCNAAMLGITVIVENPLAGSYIEGLGVIFYIMGSLLIALLSTIAGAIPLYYFPAFESVESKGLIVFVFFIVAYLIAAIFLSVYSIAADTILFCLATDRVMHGGTATVAPDSLNDINSYYKELPHDDKY